MCYIWIANSKNQPKLESLDLHFAVLTLQMLGTSTKTFQAFDFSIGGVRLVLARASDPTAKGFDSPVFHLQNNSLDFLQNNEVLYEF